MARRVRRAASGRRESRAARILAAAAVVPAILVLALPAAAAGPDAGAMLSLLNQARAEAGRPPLRHAPDLAAVATAHSEGMARSGTLRHNATLDRQVDRGQAIAENVAYSSSVEGLHRVLMRSAEHRESILSPRYDEVGVGLASSGERLWVTQVFRRSAAGPGSAPQVAPEPTPVPPPPPEPAPVAPPPPPPATTTPTTTTVPTPPVTAAPTTTTVPAQEAVPTTLPEGDSTEAAPGDSSPTTSTPPPSLPPDGFSEMPETEPSPDSSQFGPVTPTTAAPDGTTTTTVAPTTSAVDVLAALLGLTPASHSREAGAFTGGRVAEIATAALILVVLAIAFSPLRTGGIDRREQQEERRRDP